jgi:hypothetical protein
MGHGSCLIFLVCGTNKNQEDIFEGERKIAGRVISSSSSAGPNYGEACGAESRPDFVHKIQLFLKT